MDGGEGWRVGQSEGEESHGGSDERVDEKWEGKGKNGGEKTKFRPTYLPAGLVTFVRHGSWTY